MMFLYRQGKCNAPIKYGVKTMNKVIVDIVNDFELKNIGCKISQPKNFDSVRPIVAIRNKNMQIF